MPLPPNNSPLWPLMTLTVLCATLCVCLGTLYSHGFTLDKDGWTVACTAFSGVVMFVVRFFFSPRNE